MDLVFKLKLIILKLKYQDNHHWNTDLRILVNFIILNALIFGLNLLLLRPKILAWLLNVH